MCPKRNRDEVEKREPEDEEEESLSDTEEEITFLPITKEERMKKQRMNGENEEEDEEDEEDVINVEFEFSDPKEEHFKGVRNFLRYLLLGSGKDIDYSSVAEAIVKQVEVGSMVEVSGDEDIYGLLTLLNIQKYKDDKALQAILKVLRKNCPDKQKPQWDQLMKQNIGFLFNERMRNLPPELIPHLYESLGEDVKWAKDNSEDSSAFQFSHILILSPCVCQRKKGEEEELHFHFEDEVIKSFAELSFTFHVAQLYDEELSEAPQQTRTVLIVPFSKYDAIVQGIQKTLSE